MKCACFMPSWSSQIGAKIACLLGVHRLSSLFNREISPAVSAPGRRSRQARQRSVVRRGSARNGPQPYSAHSARWPRPHVFTELLPREELWRRSGDPCAVIATNGGLALARPPFDALAAPHQTATTTCKSTPRPSAPSLSQTQAAHSDADVHAPTSPTHPHCADLGPLKEGWY
jgi:hypothetical protein